MGSVPTFQANVAFSLYGILKGESDNGCGKKTFINSFHTTQGVESFTNALALAGLDNLFDLVDGEGNDDGNTDVTSTCYEDEDAEGDGDDSYGNGDKLYGGASSYGVGCTAHSNKNVAKFAIHTYGGGMCDANEIIETIDTLDDFNDRLGLSKCVPIYTEGDYYGDDDEDSSSPLALLASSRACRLYDGTGSCPDPYGKLKQYERALQKATLAVQSGPWWTPYRVMAMGWSFIGIGIFAFLIGFVMISLDLCAPTNTMASQDADPRESAKPLDRSASQGTQKSQLSKALSVVSQLSRAASRSLGLDGTDGSKTSKKSSKSKSSTKSKSSRRSSRSQKSTKSTRSHQSNQSHVSDKLDTHIVMNRTISHQSELSIGSNDEPVINLDTEDKDDRSVASAAQDMVTYFKAKAEELFHDEDGDDQSVEVKLPQEEPVEKLPYAAPTSARALDETEVTGQEEVYSKKKHRKRQWFKKLVGGAGRK